MAVVIVLFTFLTLGANTALADEPSADLRSIVGTKVYTASKRKEDHIKAASSIFVITQDDLRDLNVDYFVDALKLAPGLQVSKINSSKWMVSSRGFGEQFANKLLVMIDGRPIYNTLFSGVLWDHHLVPIHDIEQIEVIRGTGASLWGSNAVNGVINVITKRADSADSTFVSPRVGINHLGELSEGIDFAYSDELSSQGEYRVSGSLNNNASYASADSLGEYDDSWNNGTIQFRYDSKPNTEHSFNVHSGISYTNVNQSSLHPTLSAPFTVTSRDTELSRNAFVKAEFVKSLSKTDSLSLVGFIDYTDWKYASVKPQFANVGIEAQHDTLLFNKYNFMTGIGYRATFDNLGNSNELRYNPSNHDAHYVDGFFQLDVPLYGEDFIATLGSKFESNTYESFAASPNLKLSYHANPFTTIWGSVSKAHRIPSRGTQHLVTRVSGTPDGYIALYPNEDFKSEEVRTVDAGVRLNPLRGLHVDTSAFVSEYDNLRTFIADREAAVDSDIFLPLRASNLGEATIHGIEVSVKYQISPKYKLQVGYSYHELDFATEPGFTDSVFLSTEDAWPEQIWNGLFSYKINSEHSLSIFANYIDSTNALDVPAYFKADVNYFWRPKEDIELVLGIRNLLDTRHPEFSAPLLGRRAEVPREYVARLRLSF